MSLFVQLFCHSVWYGVEYAKETQPAKSIMCWPEAYRDTQIALKSPMSYNSVVNSFLLNGREKKNTEQNTALKIHSERRVGIWTSVFFRNRTDLGGHFHCFFTPFPILLTCRIQAGMKKAAFEAHQRAFAHISNSSQFLGYGWNMAAYHCRVAEKTNQHISSGRTFPQM